MPEGIPDNPEEFAAGVSERYAYASNEIGLFRRSAGALAEVLRGEEDPLSLLFGSGEPSAADLYFKAPVWAGGEPNAGRHNTNTRGRSVRRKAPAGDRGRGGHRFGRPNPSCPSFPKGGSTTPIPTSRRASSLRRRGCSATAAAASSTGCWTSKKTRWSRASDAHGYDLLIASNVLHAHTRYLEETLTHCRALLAPSGHLVALENLCGQDWLDMTFGQLDGWWRFSDECRPIYALAGPDVWRQSLAGAGFEGMEILGPGGSESAEMPDRGVILAQLPEEVAELPGVWVLAADRGGEAEQLAAELASRNQTVVLASEGGQADGGPADENTGVIHTSLEMERRESWEALTGGGCPEMRRWPASCISLRSTATDPARRPRRWRRT